MLRKGQVTLFILIALLLVVSVLLFSSQPISTQSLPPEVEPVKHYVESCLRVVGEDAILYTTSRGGFVDAPLMTKRAVAYYFYSGLNLIPSQEQVEGEIAEYVNASLPFCLRSFKELPEFTVTQGPINTRVGINKGKIDFILYMPLQITAKDLEMRLDTFTATIPNVRLYTMLNSLGGFIQNQVRNPSLICISCLGEIAAEEGMHVDIFEDGEDVYFALIDNQSRIHEQPLRFLFANKYKPISCESLDELGTEMALLFTDQCLEQILRMKNYTLKLEPVPDFKIPIGEPFTYVIKAQGQNLKYVAHTELFALANNIIHFTPTEAMRGIHPILIEVHDSYGQKAEDLFTIEIT